MMTGLNKSPLLSYDTLSRFWQGIPVLIRAIISGLLVFAIVGTAARALIFLLIPVPWSIIVMGIVLWLYWKYFSGSWWPKRTATTRRHNFRSTSLSKGVWKWSLLAALSGVVIMESSLVITFRINEFPAETWTLGYDFSAVPLWMVWILLMMVALVAGITEEVGFRGYMQVPLEERYGPVTGITIVSIVFVIVHLNQAWAPPVLPLLFTVSLIWGILAYTSGSLIPAMLSHTVADIFNFSYWWTDVAGTFDKRPILETGLDAHFVIWIFVFVASVSVFIWTARRTLAERRRV